MKRIGTVIATGMLLTGCAVPVGVQVASLAIQGISLAATEKTPGDHVISLVAEKDCATWRVFAGDPICSDLPVVESPIAVAEVEGSLPTPETVPESSSWALSSVAVVPLPQVAEFVTAARPDMSAEDTSQPAGAASAVPVNTALVRPLPAKPILAKATPSAVPPSDSIYLVVASFDTTERAQQLAGRHATLKTHVVKGEAKGNTVYRVVVGPFAKSGQAAERRRLVSAGIANAWAMPYDVAQVVVAPGAKPLQVAEAVIGR